MEINKTKVFAEGIRISIIKEGKEVGRAYLYLMHNDLHPGKLFGLLEDVFVEEDARGEDLGRKLTEAIIDEAKKYHCYKLIATSRHERPHVHRLYESLGFKDHGKEFRLDLE